MPGTMPDAMPRKKYGETSFGERLQAIRKARGLTQVQLAEAAGTTQRAISYYETEAGFPPAPAVIDLAKALNVTTDELLDQTAPGRACPRRQRGPSLVEEIPAAVGIAGTGSESHHPAGQLLDCQQR